ncbi:MAG TPA: MarR family transcriptional regulator [bacterium]|nr:MarR family transcriptional regulator [bacterium]
MKEQALVKMKDALHHIYEFEAYLAHEHKMLLNEAIVLAMLGDGKTRRSTDLARELGTTFSMMSRTLAALEKPEYITRAFGKEDKREMYFTISKAGQKKLATLNTGFDFSGFLAEFNK